MEQLREYVRAVLASIDQCNWVDHPSDKSYFGNKWLRFRLINRDRRKVLEFHKFDVYDHLLCIARTKTCAGYSKPTRIRLEKHDEVVEILTTIAADVGINIP